MKCCITCKNFNFECGKYGYSEYTPVYDAYMSCLKNYWHMNMNIVSEREYRETLLKAETCKNYKFFKDK